MRKFLHDCRFANTVSMTMHQLLSACFEKTPPASSCGGHSSGKHDNNEEDTYSYSCMSHNAPTSLEEPFDEFASLAALHRIYSISCCCNSDLLFDNFVKHLFDQSESGILAKKYISIKQWCDIGSQFQVRVARGEDADVMAEIFSEGHAEYVAKYSAVRAHIKHSRKLIYDTLLSGDGKEKSQQTNRCFYVVEDLSTQNGMYACINVLLFNFVATIYNIYIISTN
jgi:hypothetical protein